MANRHSSPCATKAPSKLGGLYIGLISGTSVDAIDAALVRVGDDGTVQETVATRSAPLDPGLIERIRAVTGATPLRDICALDHDLGRAFASAALSLPVSGDEAVTAIGCHGQTVWHAPNNSPPATVQLGDPNVIAAATGLVTVADFRRRDLAEGGQGAPLAPIFHRHCLASDCENRAVLNLGGIANLSFLVPGRPPRGFDTGPANTLLDAWCRRYLQASYDAGGHWAATGRVDEDLLRNLLSDPFFAATPPKSTGPEYFNLEWLDARLAPDIRPENVQATLAELTAATVADALSLHSETAVERLLVCGGGAHNSDLMGRLRRRLPGIPVESTDAVNVAPDFVEATGFAWLAWARLAEHPADCPATTGAGRPAVLGGVYHGRDATRPARQDTR